MRPATVPLPPGPVEIILSVEISDGSLSSKLRIPVSASAAERSAATIRWLEIMQFGLKQQGTEIEIVATIPPATPEPRDEH